MKRLLIVLLVLILMVFAAWKLIFDQKKKPSGPKPEPIAVSQHSDAFNQSMQQMMNSYYAMTEAFVNWDTAAVNKTTVELKISLDSLKLQEMEKDTAIYPTVQSQWEAIKTEIAGLINDQGLMEKRASLNMLSQQIFDLLRIVRYDAAKVYYQECPMALNDYEMPGYWLSNEGQDEKRRNPYLGLHDPRYSKGMLKCGETRDSINFIAADTTNK
jgi:uncharacterized protein DUF3347